MKRLILILSVVFSLISCSKDSNQTTLDRLCNKWELTRWEHYNLSFAALCTKKS